MQKIMHFMSMLTLASLYACHLESFRSVVRARHLPACIMYQCSGWVDLGAGQHSSSRPHPVDACLANIPASQESRNIRLLSTRGSFDEAQCCFVPHVWCCQCFAGLPAQWHQHYPQARLCVAVSSSMNSSAGAGHFTASSPQLPEATRTPVPPFRSVHRLPSASDYDISNSPSHPSLPALVTPHPADTPRTTRTDTPSASGTPAAEAAATAALSPSGSSFVLAPEASCMRTEQSDSFMTAASTPVESVGDALTRPPSAAAVGSAVGGDPGGGAAAAPASPAPLPAADAGATSDPRVCALQQPHRGLREHSMHGSHAYTAE